MVSELLYILVFFVAGVIVLLLAFSGIDSAFNTAAPVGFGKLLGLNTLVLLAGGLCWLGIYLLYGKFAGVVDKLIPNDKVVPGLIIAMSLAAMYFIKLYLLDRFGLVFRSPALVIIGELLVSTIPPWLAYLALRAFGQAFKN